MADDKKTTEAMTHNMTKLKADILEGVKAIQQHKSQRTAENQEIAAIRDRLVTKGIHKKALDMAIAYSEWDEDKRQGFDVAYNIVREALGAPFNAQGELFPVGDDDDDGGEE